MIGPDAIADLVDKDALKAPAPTFRGIKTGWKTGRQAFTEGESDLSMPSPS